MNEIMAKFLKRYKDNITSATVLNEENATDFYEVKYKAWVLDVYSPSLEYTEYEGNCKVSVDEFTKFKKIEEAVIWE